MKKVQEAFRSMLKKLNVCLDDFSKLWEKNKLFAGAVTIIRAKDKEITQQAIIQEEVAKEWANEKKKYRTEINDATFFIYGIVRTFALSIGDDVLYKQFDKSKTDIRRISDTNIDTTTTFTIETMDKHKDELMNLGITQEIYDAYLQSVANYDKVNGRVKEVIAQQALATKTIDKLIKEIRTVLDKELDTYIMQYMKSNPEFYDTYWLARKIDDNPTLHSALLGLILNEDTGQPEPKVKITATWKAGHDFASTVKISDKAGRYKFPKLEPGVWIITYEKLGFDTITVELEIYKGKSTRHNLQIRPTE